ncbi:hypothetical protein [Streptosporangium carneum]|uniref:Uncharacterized protein n=1 Tax=Streptosporangium carneum TaxID=47481 RepID=A0A9W6I517_9ACTN|nr:hypothetical protein [Streptosporangium carneum]GLK12210.1 hypothetical protein GCM10017600_56190 [Streptosporangium carneum]
MPLTERGRRRWRIVALALLAIVLALIVKRAIDWADLRKKPEITDLAGMMVAVVTLTGVAITLFKWALRRQPPLAVPTDTMITAAKAALADLVQQQWKEEARSRSRSPGI